jgi:hypothetical protein
MNRTLVIGLAAASLLLPAFAFGQTTQATDSSATTRSGTFPLQLGLPANDKTIQQIYDELDYQRASQAYIWALPIVAFAQWQYEARTIFGARDTDVVLYDSVADKMGILTPNGTTPYTIGFPDLSKTGPLVVAYPAGASAGGVGDFWQRPITDMGQTGPDKGAGAKYLILGPGQSVASTVGYRAVHSPTFNITVAFRALDPDPKKSSALIEQFRMYPYADRANPSKTRVLHPDGRIWSQMQPRGIAYWQRLSDIINREPVMERDRMFMAMIAPLGIQKGKPFSPDQRQTKLLEQGAEMGELMAQALGFRSRLAGVRYRPQTHWESIINFDPVTQESKYFTQLDERTNYFYQAVTTSKGMVTKTPGVGQAYLAETQDGAGNWFDGGKTYRLHVPANPPAQQFWSLTLYDALTREFITNPQNRPDRSSRNDIDRNPDGSVDLYMGPNAPAGHENNWIPTVSGKSWFAYFRLYAPTRAYFDRTFALPDIEEYQ